jgi:hypothetical protein
MPAAFLSGVGGAFLRHARPWGGYPRLSVVRAEVVDGRAKPGHDEERPAKTRALGQDESGQKREWRGEKHRRQDVAVTVAGIHRDFRSDISGSRACLRVRFSRRARLCLQSPHGHEAKAGSGPALLMANGGGSRGLPQPPPERGSALRFGLVHAHPLLSSEPAAMLAEPRFPFQPHGARRCGLRCWGGIPSSCPLSSLVMPAAF